MDSFGVSMWPLYGPPLQETQKNRIHGSNVEWHASMYLTVDDSKQ